MSERNLKIVEEKKPEIISIEDAKLVIEALLFSSSKVLSIRQLSEITEIEETQMVRHLIKVLNQEYEENGRTFRIQDIGDGVQMRTLPKYKDWVQKLEPIRTAKLSLPTIETLSIIAYKQPITRSEVEFIRGVDSSHSIRNLMDKKLIKIVGKEDLPGRPLIYGTTRHFLEVFGLHNIKQLPALPKKELEEPEESDDLKQIEDEDIPQFAEDSNKVEANDEKITDSGEEIDIENQVVLT